MARWHERVKAEAMASEQIRKNKSEKLEAYFDATTDGATDLFVGAEKKEQTRTQEKKARVLPLSHFFLRLFLPDQKIEFLFFIWKKKEIWFYFLSLLFLFTDKDDAYYEKKLFSQ